MVTLRVAVATDDGVSLMDRHFGDAGFFEVFDVHPDGCEALCRVLNDTEEEDGHADPKKAGGIMAILGSHGVQVAVSRFFGPNIKRIRKRFVCVLTRHRDVTGCLDQIRAHLMLVATEWDNGEERGFLDMRAETRQE